MKKIWKTIIEWLKKNAPEVIDDLLPGIDEGEIKAAEKLLDTKFPASMKNSLMLYNGQLGMSAYLMGEWQIISLKISLQAWADIKDSFAKFPEINADPKEEIPWHNKMLPIAYNGAGDYYCIDLDESSEKYGLITSYWHVGDNKKEIIANNYEEWLKTYADDLQEGKYQYTDERLIKVDH